MEISNYPGIIFDLDGTLLDTLTDLAASTNRVLAGHGLATHPVDVYRYFVGDGMRMLVERALPPEKRAAEVIDAIFSELHADYGKNWAEATRPYAGVVELLAGLQQRGIVMSVLSNKPDEFTAVMVRKYFPEVPFKCIYGASHQVAKKPDPAGALRIAAETGIKPEQTMYLGDTLVDMKTAVAAGMFPIGALWGFRDEAELRAGGAKLMLQHPMQLLSPTEARIVKQQPGNPLHGITLEKILTVLREHYSWKDLNQRIELNCFFSHPSIKSSLTFLRKNAWARKKVENLYLELVAQLESAGPVAKSKSLTSAPGPRKKK